MAAVLACGEGAFLTHLSAGALYGICPERRGRVEVGVRGRRNSVREGLRVRERPSLPGQDVGTLHRIPVTSPVRTLIDLATEQGPRTLMRTINQADNRDVIRADDLRREVEAYAGQPGVKVLRRLLDRDTFVLSDEELERLVLPMALEVGFSLPETKEMVNGFEVDFYWPDLKLVVETDGLRYHRTPAAQARDALRDQTHTAAGYTRLRFSHHQVKHEPAHVKAILRATASRLPIPDPRG
jgi:very-short-patch-repair endonuclease